MGSINGESGFLWSSEIARYNRPSLTYDADWRGEKGAWEELLGCLLEERGILAPGLPCAVGGGWVGMGWTDGLNWKLTDIKFLSLERKNLTTLSSLVVGELRANTLVKKGCASNQK